MRRPRLSIVLLFAAFLALALSPGGFGNVKAYADGADFACGFNDWDGSVNPDGYAQGFVSAYDNFLNQWERVGFDIQAYRVTEGANPLPPFQPGSCYRAYYGSVWNDSRYTMWGLTAHLRVWVCGTPRADIQQVSYNVWGRAVVSYRPNQVWSNGDPWGQYTLAVRTPDGNTWSLDFQRYGDTSALCGKQVDNQISSYQDNSYSPGSGYVYVNDAMLR